MTIIIAVIILLGYLLIATERLTHVNKAAVAMFTCTVGWVLYISYGTDYVASQHLTEYAGWLDGAVSTSARVKQYIAGNVFIKYVGRASEVVLYLLATMTIVELLDDAGCFDFITVMLKTRHSRRLLWTLSLVTLFISANLDNLTTTVMMLMAMRKVVPNRRQRLAYGSAIVIAANCGGAVTVIGDPAGLMLWNNGLVTPSAYFLAMFLPCVVAWLVPTWWLGRSLPDHVDTAGSLMVYRGDDSRLKTWQRISMLVWGIGGLWFTPTFHSITKLSPFLGALCVLGVLWVMNEVFNRKLLNMDATTRRRVPTALAYSSHQLILFVLGVMLMMGVAVETGIAGTCWHYVNDMGIPAWAMALGAGTLSSVLDNFAAAAGFITLNTTAAYGDPYWNMVAYGSAVGGNVLVAGSLSGLALMKAERVHSSWYFMHVGWMAMVGALAGFLLMVCLI